MSPSSTRVSAETGGGEPLEGAPVVKLSARDARLTTDLVNGVTRWRRKLDFVLSDLCDLQKADAVVVQVLRVAAYELLERGLPAHALSEHVEIAKRALHSGAAKFANGVLRNLARKIEAGQLPEVVQGRSAAATPEELAVRWSHPTWMVRRWVEQLGAEDAQRLLECNNRRPLHSIRVAGGPSAAADTLQLLREAGAEASPSPLLPGAFVRVQSGLQKVLDGSILPRGSFAVQDESAGMVVMVLDPQPGERVIDCCAAPGGKALFIAERMGNKGELTVMDANGRRLQALRKALKDRGLDHVSVIEADLRRFAEAPANCGRFDRVLLDAPCSGLGVLSKRADLRWRRSPEDLRASIALAVELIEAAAVLVAPGGVIVYSTCSIDREENLVPVRHLLSHGATTSSGQLKFELASVSENASIPGNVIYEGMMATFPHVHGVDGAFAAKFRRIC